ncbi:MAG: RNA polymerase factor sigma-54 [Pseudomonadota bacterium]
MELTQSLRQTTRLAMTQHMQQSLQVLQMTTAELCLFLEERAQENPFLRATLPKPIPRDTGPRPDCVPGWDGTAHLAAPDLGLYAYLSERIEVVFADARRRQVAEAFLNALEPSGWLSQSVEAVALAASVSVPVAEGVLAELQQIEPAGVFSRSLAECLLLQAKAENLLTWELETLIAHLPLLAEGRVDELADLCDCAAEDIPEIVAVLKGFDPKPGLQFSNDLPPIFPPDMTAHRGANGWEVSLTKSALPSLKVLDDDDVSLAGQERQASRSEALALVIALEKRNATLLRVGAALVRHQGAYLEKGPGNLTPLTLEMLAGELNLHASTISRVCAGRMVAGPRGALPLKALFSRPVDAIQGAGGVSQDKVIEEIRSTIASELPERPLSDATIVSSLAQRDIHIARRTVAKYRELLGIPASSQRRRRH